MSSFLLAISTIYQLIIATFSARLQNRFHALSSLTECITINILYIVVQNSITETHVLLNLPSLTTELGMSTYSHSILKHEEGYGSHLQEGHIDCSSVLSSSWYVPPRQASPINCLLRKQVFSHCVYSGCIVLPLPCKRDYNCHGAKNPDPCLRVSPNIRII